jgi:hypothetical protein
VKWTEAWWPLVALALNAMIQRSPADHFSSNPAFSPARSSFVICMADILVFAIWMFAGFYAGLGPRRAAKQYRSALGVDYPEDDTLHHGIPTVGLILFLLIPCPQILRVYGMNGESIRLTQFFATIFLMAYGVTVLANTLGVPRANHSGVATHQEKLHETTRNKLTAASNAIYISAFLIQVILWLVIIGFVFKDLVKPEITTKVANTIQVLGKGSYYFIIVGLFITFPVPFCFNAKLPWKVAGVFCLIVPIILLVKVPVESFQNFLTTVSGPFDGVLTYLVLLIIGLAIIVGGVLIVSFIGALFETLDYYITGLEVRNRAEKKWWTTTWLLIKFCFKTFISYFSVSNSGSNPSRLSTRTPPARRNEQSVEAEASGAYETNSQKELDVLPPRAYLKPGQNSSEVEPSPMRHTGAVDVYLPGTDTDHAALRSRKRKARRAKTRPEMSKRNGSHHGVSSSDVNKISQDKAGTGQEVTNEEDTRKPSQLLLGFVVSNLMCGILYYALLFNGEGTSKAAWTRAIS